MNDYHPHFWAIVHGHFCEHIQMESESNKDQCSLTLSYLMIAEMLVPLDGAHEKYSTAVIWKTRDMRN